METDILFGRNGGIKTCLVFSGVTLEMDYENMKLSKLQGLKEIPKHFYEPDCTSKTLYHFVENLLTN
ncbi:hypothetical protein HZS_322 [Henneguya salminicola]|nr:hypothetical protein HZS_322 [Henneguya salminicola]